MDHVKFNEPYFSGNELKYIKRAIESGHVSGNGPFTKKCQAFFENKWKFRKCFLTNSCTDALEMAAILSNVQPGDEVIVPSFTYPSTALAFQRQGAKIVFADSEKNHPCLAVNELEKLITSKTKVIVPVHYAGVACDMDAVLATADKHKIIVIEDAAHAIGSYYRNRPLGGLGHFGCFSFHESKNIHCGQGGMLTINDESFIERAEIIWEAGTNRASFYRGEIPKYECVDIGSSFLASDISAAFLYAQLEVIDDLHNKRTDFWNLYLSLLSSREWFGSPFIPEYTSHNAHIFYILTQDPDQRDWLIRQLNTLGIASVFHYQSLHRSPYFISENMEVELPNSENFSNCLIRLPLHYNLNFKKIEFIADAIIKSFEK